MPSISDLNDSTLRRVFSYLVRVPMLNIAELVTYLPYLGVCERWRSMLIHSLYQQAFIIFIPPTDPDARDKNYALETNIDLIALCGWQNLVVTLSISLYNSYDIYRAVELLIDCYISKGKEWSGVCELSLSIYGNVYRNSPMRSYTSDPATIQKYHILGERFAECVRNVRYLDIRQYTDDYIPYSFVSALFGTYGRNLKHISCYDAVIPRSLVYFSNELTHLNIRMVNVDVSYFPIVLSPSLTCLQLTGLPHSFSMRPFAHYDKVMDVYFSNLKTLCLQYKKSVSTHTLSVFSKRQYHYNIYMPKLTTLTLENTSADCDILYSLSGLSLEGLYYTGNIQCLEYLSLQSLVTSKDLYVKIVDVTNSLHTRFYQTTNRLFSNCVSERKTRLIISTLELDLKAENTNWLYLDTLKIGVCISINALLNLIRKLQNLSYLKIYGLTSSSMTDTLDDILLGVCNLPTPMCPNLKRLKIKRRAAYNAVTHEQMVATIVYLSAHIPSISTICTLEEFVQDIKSLFSAKLIKYPHLKDIDLCVAPDYFSLDSDF